MKQYKHTQIGIRLSPLHPVIALVISLPMGYLTIVTGFEPFAVGGLVGGPIGIVTVLVLSTRLTVSVDDQRIETQFGPIVIHNVFYLKDIETYSVLKNFWYCGWRIRLTPRGGIFDVSSLSAIVLQMKSGKRHRFATDDPDNLAKALDEALSV